MGAAKCSLRGWGSANIATVGPGWRYSCATKGSERGARSEYPLLEGFKARPDMESRLWIGGRIGLGPRDALSERCMW
jgi:hypothetical protein